MELNGISLDKLDEKIKKSGIREKAAETFNKVRDFTTEHWREILVGICGVAAAGEAVGNGLNRLARHRENKMKHQNYCYDRSLGHYWELRRDPSNAEWTEINTRKKNGESLFDILKSMRLLK